jgi:ribonuclease Y
MGPGDPLLWICICLALVLGLLGGYGAARLADRTRLNSTRAQAAEITEAAKREADNIIKAAELASKEEIFQKREGLEQEAELKRKELREQERRVEKREDGLEQKHQTLLKKERILENGQRKLGERKAELEKKTQEVEELRQVQLAELHRISEMSREQAQTLLLERIQRELSEEIAQRLRRHEENIRTAAEEKAREILATCIQRYAAEHTADTTVSTVDIPSDDMKGRIIGREGRNIRTFEKCTGVDVIVDDTPGVVIVSAFDNVRRETARLALTKLIQDGRIHPSRIEEVVTETQTEMDKHIMEVGKKAVQDANVGPVHEKLLQLMGRLKFRTSYSQNVLQHSLEVAHLCGMMAEELGLDGRLARRCGLLHDVGKAADHEMEGGHPKIGAELAKRYGETSKEVLHAIAGHHDDVTIDHIYTVLVAAADAISSSRPGARRETLEKYVKRLEELETVASGFPGVEHAYAIQAGREVRVIANASQTSDSDALRVCREIARAIEQQLHYPGEIKVTVVRETRAVEYAR